jgi:hypothetical protein
MATRPRRHRARRPGAGLLARVALALALLAAPAAQAQSGDAAAKARFAVTLARFVQWPAGSEQAPLRLCVLQNSAALARAFRAQDGTPVGTRRVAVVLEPAGISACDLLFVDDSGARAAAPMLAEGAQRPVLTLGAVDGFLARGGMVELVNVDDTLRFDVDLHTLRQAGLGLSSHALKLARRVREGS